MCRSLGYGPEWATPYTKAHFGRGTGGVLIDEPGCRGTENSLSKCPNHAWGPGNCDHSEDAGVFCSDEVVCRMLGYEGGGIAHKKGFFGKGNGPIWLDNVDCLGNETKLSQCRHSPPGTSACLHSEDVGITCFTSNLMKTFDRSLKNKLPTSCGYQTPPFNTFLYDNLAKIVGGRTIRRLDSPWLVSLQLREKGIQKHNCGGVVISEDLVLTAAHCFRNHGKNSYVVRVGEFDLEANEPSQEVCKIFIVTELGSSIQPVCLPSFDDDYFSLTNCKITGWGTTNEQAEPIPERRPRAGAVHIYPMSTCTGETGYSMHEITSGMFCAGRMDGSVDTCTGDSGGPLTCEVNGQHILYGITSWGKGCGRKGQPGMYTKVTKYLRWLNSIVT
ncbi:Neurotrypsin [Armadillidium vulgare]|nr:Neurotrypsin [Armadillidium vulgare]